jgi:hypothetical protein
MTILDVTTANGVRTLKGWATDTDRDAILGNLIDKVSARVEGLCGGRLLYKEERTEYFSLKPGEGQIFQLAGFPVDTSQTFTVKSAFDRDWSNTTALSSSEYYLDATDGVLHLDLAALDFGTHTLQVVSTGGLGTSASDLSTEYSDLTNAARQQVAFEYEQRQRLGVLSVSGPDGSASLLAAHEILPDLKAAIDRLKLRYAG